MGFVGIGIGPQANLSADFGSGAGRVAGDYLHVNAGVEAFADCGRHVVAHRVGDAADTDELQREAGAQTFIYDYRSVVYLAAGKAECAVGVALVVEQLGVDCLAGVVAGYCGAHAEHNLRCTFHIEHLAAGDTRGDHRSHIFALGGERELLAHIGALAQSRVVDALFA